MGNAILTVAVVGLVWWVLEIVGNWKLLTKAGKPGWHSIIPVLNLYDEYDICWKGGLGIVMFIALGTANGATGATEDGSGAGTLVVIAGIAVAILQIVESYKLARAFDKGIGYTIFLIIFDRLARIVLGFGSAEYVGKRR